MASARGPPKKEKLIPSLRPDLDLPSRWRAEYSELMETGEHKQTSALRVLADRYGAPRSTLRYHIFSTDREKHIERSRRRYREARARRSKERRRIERERNNVRNHIDDVFRDVFAGVGYHAQTLAQLAELVEDSTGFAFRPASLVTLNERTLERTGKPLLEEVTSEGARRYVLHEAQLQAKDSG